MRVDDNNDDEKDENDQIRGKAFSVNKGYVMLPIIFYVFFCLSPHNAALLMECQ